MTRIVLDPANIACFASSQVLVVNECTCSYPPVSPVLCSNLSDARRVNNPIYNFCYDCGFTDSYS